MSISVTEISFMVPEMDTNLVKAMARGIGMRIDDAAAGLVVDLILKTRGDQLPLDMFLEFDRMGQILTRDEYVVRSLLVPASGYARSMGEKTIISRYIRDAIRHDIELNELFGHHLPEIDTTTIPTRRAIANLVGMAHMILMKTRSNPNKREIHHIISDVEGTIGRIKLDLAR